jgi:hypothetical protein
MTTVELNGQELDRRLGPNHRSRRRRTHSHEAIYWVPRCPGERGGAIPERARHNDRVRRFGYLAVVLCTLAVFALGSLALISSGGGTTIRNAVCTAPPQPPPVSAKLTVVPDAVKTAQPGTNNSTVQAGMVLCRARLNVTVQKLPASQPGGNGVQTVVSQWPAAGSRVPVGSDVVISVQE